MSGNRQQALLATKTPNRRHPMRTISLRSAHVHILAQGRSPRIPAWKRSAPCGLTENGSIYTVICQLLTENPSAPQTTTTTAAAAAASPPPLPHPSPPPATPFDHCNDQAPPRPLPQTRRGFRHVCGTLARISTLVHARATGERSAGAYVRKAVGVQQAMSFGMPPSVVSTYC